MKIRLLFEPKLAVYISERQWHPSQTLKKRPDGRVELFPRTCQGPAEPDLADKNWSAESH
jgi:hypothetical protein